MLTTTTRARHVAAHAALPEICRGSGFRTRKLLGELGVPIDPFVSLEHFQMWEPTFPPHPHAGFSAVTYLFPGPGGALVVRDSLGERRRLPPGGLYWMQAGRGMMHEEVPEVRGEACRGMQMLVNLAATHKRTPPETFFLDPEAIPEARPSPGACVRILCGAAFGLRAPIDPRTPVTVLDVNLAPGAPLVLAAPADRAAFVVVVEGTGEAGTAEAPVRLDPHTAAALAGDGEVAWVRAGRAGLHLVFAMGRPLGEPVVFEGPFVMSTREEIADASARYEAGEMGRLVASF
jgi:redox-sensitive bicupin YhaK (pirin superfamily)